MFCNNQAYVHMLLCHIMDFQDYGVFRVSFMYNKAIAEAISCQCFISISPQNARNLESFSIYGRKISF